MHKLSDITGGGLQIITKSNHHVKDYLLCRYGLD